MIASVKIGLLTTRGSGEADCDGQEIDELRLANVHLNYKTARKDLQAGGESYERFWDTLARYLAELRPSILCG
eukprot:3567608-Pyramimonas_sp.AAC.1